MTDCESGKIFLCSLKHECQQCFDVAGYSLGVIPVMPVIPKEDQFGLTYQKFEAAVNSGSFNSMRTDLFITCLFVKSKKDEYTSQPVNLLQKQVAYDLKVIKCSTMYILPYVFPKIMLLIWPL